MPRKKTNKTYRLVDSFITTNINKCQECEFLLRSYGYTFCSNNSLHKQYNNNLYIAEMQRS